MKTIYYTLIALLSLPAFGQIEQDINKTTGIQSNPIGGIDSIRFNVNTAEMEVVLNNGNVEPHTISDINDVTFSGESTSSGPDTVTLVVEVTNPTTGKIWMDRNLGANQVATSSTDVAAYGDLYQWGRGFDGHEKRTSGTTATLSTTDTPGHGDFITNGSSPNDWRSPSNENLWQGVNGVNNPCPSGYRIPTATELDNERLSWSSYDAAGAFASPLKLTTGGSRSSANGFISSVGSSGSYWSSTYPLWGSNSQSLFFNSSSYGLYFNFRAIGMSVRCIKD